MACSAVDGPVIVVLGAQALRLRSCLRRHALAPCIVYNGNWPNGLAGSLRMGLGRVPDGCAGALVLLTDQAKLLPSELALLIERWRRHPGLPAAAVVSGRNSAPAVLPRILFRAVRSVEGDQGARGVLRGLARLTQVPVPSAAFDLDTPADAAAISVSANR